MALPIPAGMKCWSSSSYRSRVEFRGLLIASLLLVVSTPAFAASTGNLDLSGTVAAACDVTVSPVPIASNLPLSSTQVDLLVGSVSETCNDANGYTLTAQSSNSSALLPAGGGTDSVPYTFRYDGTIRSLTGGAAEVTNVSAPTGAAGVSKSIQLSYANPGFIAADTYTDTIVFTIAAK
jgi:spore coat protein U-like protein